jgi:polyisoprenoid-binding protein YceI
MRAHFGMNGLGAWVRALGMLGAVVAASAPQSVSAEPHAYQLSEGKVRFFCEGPQVTLPAWGQFAAVASSIQFDSKSLDKTKGSAEVLLTSVNTRDAGWDTVFRSAEFLGLEEFPRSSFGIRSVTPLEPAEAGKWVPVTMQGDLFLHGVHRAITVPGSVRWSSLSGGEPDVLEVRAYFHIRWDEYNIAVPTGITRTFTGDGASIQVELSFVRAPKKRVHNKPPATKPTAPKAPAPSLGF